MSWSQIIVKVVDAVHKVNEEKMLLLLLPPASFFCCESGSQALSSLLCVCVQL